jgi:hypothetical protein
MGLFSLRVILRFAAFLCGLRGSLYRCADLLDGCLCFISAFLSSVSGCLQSALLRLQPFNFSLFARRLLLLKLAQSFRPASFCRLAFSRKSSGFSLFGSFLRLRVVFSFGFLVGALYVRPQELLQLTQSGFEILNSVEHH